MANPTRDLRALPKGHLHLHLEGSMRPTTLAELADEAGIAVPEIRGYGSFTAFADTYLAACQVLETREHFARLVYEVVEDSVVDGAVWVEPSFYAPHHRDRFGEDEEIVDMVLDALHAAGEQLGVGVGLMLAADRTVDPSVAVAQARLASVRADRGVVSFGLANDEAIGPPEPYAEAFAIATDAGLLSAPHAGELAGPESVWGALETLRPDRLQHGVRAVEDLELVKRLADSDIVLDVCPTSNLLLSVYPSFAEHPLPLLLDAGISCSLNGDDPLLFGPVLLHEYEVARSEMGLDDAALAAVARASITGSGAADGLKATALRSIDEWMASG
ncbi:MAG TPA: adenosine deaminase [Acidimicrobiia bacterium]|nr:adenosine deaminase [Acidimicrobiia bacterium]